MAQKVALFNAQYQFLHWISEKAAIFILVAEEGHPINETDKVWRSPSSSYRVPKGIALKKNVSPVRKNNSRWSRDGMFRRDEYTCQYCGVKNKELNVDHVVPRFRGGETSWTNCVASCLPCNTKKGHKTLKEAGMKLKKVPKIPNPVNDQDIWAWVMKEFEDGQDSKEE